MAVTKRPLVYIVSVFEGITDVVRCRLPDADIIELDAEKDGSLSEPGLSEVRQNAEIIFAHQPLIRDVMYNNNKLKWAHSFSAGVEKIIKTLDQIKPFPKPIITRSAIVHGESIAQYVLGYILFIERKMPRMYSEQQHQIWNANHFKEKFRMLSDLRIGIIGAGQIGKQICKVCKSNGMEVWGLSKTPKAVGSEIWEYDAHMTLADLPRLLENCDYVCNVLPSTPETTDILSGDILSSCRHRKSVFINVGRGNVISEESLVKAINNEWIGGAVLDVFRTEPLPPDSKLWSIPNVYITPHISAPIKTSSVAELFVSNYNKFIKGEPLDFTINWAAGY